MYLKPIKKNKTKENNYSCIVPRAEHVWKLVVKLVRCDDDKEEAEEEENGYVMLWICYVS